jgi:hypothetical protein
LASYKIVAATKMNRPHLTLFPLPTLALLLASALTAPAQQIALLAHDLSGFALDMTVSQVAAVAGKPLTAFGAGHYQVTIDTIDYDFGFSAQGHLYRIDSLQQMGIFVPDSVFASTLIARLMQKFGPPQTNQLPSGPAIWMYQETYTGPKGEKLSRETESLTVLLAGEKGQPVSVEIQLIAPRIQRRDAERPPVPPK